MITSTASSRPSGQRSPEGVISENIGWRFRTPRDAIARIAGERGIDWVHVPFRGAGPMLVEAVAGRLDAGCDNMPSCIGHIRDGRLRALAVTTEKRAPALPETPTTREAGFPTVDAVAWFGIQVPARTPKPVIERLAAEIQAAVRDPAIRAKIEEQGAEPVGNTPEQFEAYIRSEIARWGEVVRRANVSLD